MRDNAVICIVSAVIELVARLVNAVLAVLEHVGERSVYGVDVLSPRYIAVLVHAVLAARPHCQIVKHLAALGADLPPDGDCVRPVGVNALQHSQLAAVRLQQVAYLANDVRASRPCKVPRAHVRCRSKQ